MRRWGARQKLLAGSTLMLLVIPLALVAAAPGHGTLWLALSVLGLVAIVGVLFGDLSRTAQQRDALLGLVDGKDEEVQRLTVELTELDLVDPLTGARNRRGFIDLVDHQMKIAAREWRKLHFLYVDIDELELINAEHGHAAGDAALIEVVQTIWASSRNVDIVGRVGGDEFAVALIHADDPWVVADRIRRVLSARTRDADHPYELHVSVGVATFDPATPVSLDEMFRAASRSMYEERRAAAEARARKLAAPNAR